jgi:hypothetical protein
MESKILGRPLHFQTLTAGLNSKILTASYWDATLSITANNYPSLPYTTHKVKLNKRRLVPWNSRMSPSYLMSCRFSNEPSSSQHPTIELWSISDPSWWTSRRRSAWIFILSRELWRLCQNRRPWIPMKMATLHLLRVSECFMSSHIRSWWHETCWPLSHCVRRKRLAVELQLEGKRPCHTFRSSTCAVLVESC